MPGKIKDGWRVKKGARPLLNLPFVTLYRDIDIEPIPRPLKRCSICGNPMREMAVVAADRYREVCPRCLAVVQDRTNNMAFGDPILPIGVPGKNTMWRDGEES